MPTNESKTPTGIEAEVCNDISIRQERGLSKYGISVADNPLSILEWLNHAYEECLDQSIYLKRLLAGLTTITEENKKLKEDLERCKKDRDFNKVEWDAWKVILDSGLEAIQKHTGLTKAGITDGIEYIVKERDQLKSQLAELQADKEMLDWLALGHSLFALTQKHVGKSNPMFEVTTQENEFQDENIRLAITAAMKGTK